VDVEGSNPFSRSKIEVMGPVKTGPFAYLGFEEVGETVVGAVKGVFSGW
jgi:hypothetical protein